MRTTIDLESDVLAAAKELARTENVAIGKVISRLVRSALSGQNLSHETPAPGIGGFRPFPARGKIVTNEQIDKIRDAEGT